MSEERSMDTSMLICEDCNRPALRVEATGHLDVRTAVALGMNALYDRTLDQPVRAVGLAWLPVHWRLESDGLATSVITLKFHQVLERGNVLPEPPERVTQR
jgi:hypothetical protein